MSSIIFGLAIAELFSRSTKIISNSQNVKIHWIPFGYAATIFLLIISRWWVIFLWKPLESEITYNVFLYLLTFPILLFIAGTLVLPDVEAERSYDLLKHFYKIRIWFFSAIVFTILFDLVETLMKGTSYLSSLGMSYWVLVAMMLTACFTGMFSRNRWIHLVIILLMASASLLYK